MGGAIDRALAHWRRCGVPLLPPADPAAVAAVWRQLGRELSADVAALYAAVGGYEGYYEDDRLWCLWSVGRVAEENAARPCPGVRFSDFLIASHWYAFRYEGPGRSSVWVDDSAGDGWRVAGGVEEFLNRYLDNPASVGLMESV